jgi:hypothetical protein
MAKVLFRPTSHKNQKPCRFPHKRRGGRLCIDFATIFPVLENASPYGASSIRIS